MWATSEEFNDALYGSGRGWRSKVDILFEGQFVQALDVLLDGSITMDSVAVRRSGSFKMTDPTGRLAPADAHDLLAPKGTELRPYRGLVLPGGAIEWVPLGVLGISEPTVSRRDGSTIIELRAQDRGAAVRSRRFEEPYVIPNGTPTHQAIGGIVTSRLDVPVRLQVTGHTTPSLTYDALEDPWKAATDLAESDSMVAAFDPLGTLSVTRDEPVPTGVLYTPGVDSMMVENSRSISGDTTYSGVIVRIEHPEQDPILVKLWDLDNRSPTYALGPFGKRPYGYSSPLIKTVGQAEQAARTLLRRVTRMRQELTLTHVGHPGHEIGDLVEVIDPSTRTRGEWVVIGGSVPLRPQKSTLKLLEASYVNPTFGEL